jgi:hypothetical protein
MSEMSEKVRRERQQKAERYCRTDPNQKVDASGYRPPDALNADTQTAARPHPRKFKRGGSVKVEGEGSTRNVGRMPRAAGGKIPKGYYDDNKPNLRLVKVHTGPNGHVAKVYKDKDWDEHRVKYFRPDGTYLSKADSHHSDKQDAHDDALSAVERGTFKRGGSVHSDRAEDLALIRKEVKSSALRKGRDTGGAANTQMPPDLKALYDKRAQTAGHNKRSRIQEQIDKMESGAPKDRVARAEGGKVKHKKGTNITINIGENKPPVPPMMPPPHPPMMPPPGPPPGMPGAPPPGAGGPPPGAPPPGMAGPPPMPRARGGRAFTATKMLAEHDTGSGGGKGRLAKIRAYGCQD